VIVTGASRGIGKVLCANAGIFPAAKLDDLTPEGWDQVLNTNLKGTFLTIKACLPAMKTKRKGRIIVTSSITGPITGYPGWTHYVRAKRGSLASCTAPPPNWPLTTSRSTLSCQAISRQRALMVLVGVSRQNDRLDSDETSTLGKQRRKSP
jgi:hypothetical protein